MKGEKLTGEEREERVNFLKTLLLQIGVYDTRYSAINKFEKICQDFIDHGDSVDGKIPFPELNKKICYIISNRKHIKPTLWLMDTTR